MRKTKGIRCQIVHGNKLSKETAIETYGWIPAKAVAGADAAAGVGLDSSLGSSATGAAVSASATTAEAERVLARKDVCAGAKALAVLAVAAKRMAL